MKRIYLVRHGETNSNKNHIVQGLEDELSDTGLHQAVKVATRLQNLTFEAFYSSDAKRAIDTAQAIADATGKEFETSPLFREIKRPSSFVGTSRESEAFTTFLRNEYDHMEEPDWQFEDGEHFGAGAKRAREALEFLEGLTATSALVVTHGHFMRYMVATILSGKRLTPELWRPLSVSLLASNTGVTMCEYSTTHDRWRVITWNDHAYFAQ